MSRDPKFAAGLSEWIDTHERSVVDQAVAHDTYLANIKATSRRLNAGANLAPAGAPVYGDHCVVCDQRWCLPADKATCAHMAVCEDCWPNGCEHCEREVEAGIRRREKATQRILSLALELRTGADDLSETDMRQLDWIRRNDLTKNVAHTIEALRRVEDVLRSQTAGSR